MARRIRTLQQLRTWRELLDAGDDFEVAFRETGNPVFVWFEIDRILTARESAWPQWVTDYLQASASSVTDLWATPPPRDQVDRAVARAFGFKPRRGRRLKQNPFVAAREGWAHFVISVARVALQVEQGMKVTPACACVARAMGVSRAVVERRYQRLSRKHHLREIH